MKYLAVIPARGGSKGIPLKNIYNLCGKPLIEYTLDLLDDFTDFDIDVAVSTDSDDIASVASKYDWCTIIQRPTNISGNKASTESALIHALEHMQKTANVSYDAVITLQPTSPLRQKDTLKNFLTAFEKNVGIFDAQLTLNENFSDFWIKNGDVFSRLYPNAPRRRQERQPLLVENSCIYVTLSKSLLCGCSVLGRNVNGFIISETEAVDINEMDDIYIAEAKIINNSIHILKN